MYECVGEGVYSVWVRRSAVSACVIVSGVGMDLRRIHLYESSNKHIIIMYPCIHECITCSECVCVIGGGWNKHVCIHECITCK